MAKTRGRVVVSSNIEDVLTHAKKVFEQHQQEGAKSLLNSLDDMDWATIGPKIDYCLLKHQEAVSLEKKMEEAYRERDLSFPEIKEIYNASKNLLKAVYSKNPKKLGEWGFVVDDSPQIKTKKAVKP